MTKFEPADSMTMNNSSPESPNDRFESRLSNQTLRHVPANWKQDILQTAARSTLARQRNSASKPVSRFTLGVEWRWLLGLWSASIAALALLGLPSGQSTKPTCLPVGDLWSIYQVHRPEVLRLAALPDGDLPEPPVPPPPFLPRPHSALRRISTHCLG